MGVQEIVTTALEHHVRMVREYSGAPGVMPERLAEALKVRGDGTVHRHSLNGGEWWRMRINWHDPGHVKMSLKACLC